jgi:siroheme synthase-like protein
MFPLCLDLTDRLVVVVGAGPVGRRKADAVRGAGARVRMVCLEGRPIEEIDPSCEWLSEPYRAAHLDGAALVFAAASPEVNIRVVADARALGVWVNSASDPARGDFQVPAVVRRGDFVVAISTGGAAPALAAAVRQRLEGEFDEAFGAWVELLAEVRPAVLAEISAGEVRRQVFERLCRWEWLERLRREGREKVREAMWAEVQGWR